MSVDVYSPECVDCCPTIVNPMTGVVFPPESPEMQAVSEVWATMGAEVKKSFHAVTCLNSRKPEDLERVQPLLQEISAALSIAAIGIIAKEAT